MTPREPSDVPSASENAWFAVRCFFRVQVTWYEERVTLWRASGHDEAIELAEAEALEYARILQMTYLDLSQSYKLSDDEDPSRPGAEVFSLFRESGLQPSEYLERFFDTGKENQGQ